MKYVVNNKKYGSIEKFINEIINIPAVNLKVFLEETSVFINKTEIREILYSLLNPIVKDILKDESVNQEFKTSLKFFESYSLFQLQNLAKMYSNIFNFKKFKFQFLYIFLRKIENYGINRYNLVKLLNLSLSIKKTSNNDVYDFLHTLNDFLIDKKDTIDGINIKDFEISIVNGSLNNDIEEFSTYHNISIPTELNREQMLDTILYSIKRNDITLNRELIETLKQYDIYELEKYSLKNKLHVRISLKGLSMCEYILKILEDKYLLN